MRNTSEMNMFVGGQWYRLKLSSFSAGVIYMYIKALPSPLKSLAQFAVQYPATASEGILGPELNQPNGLIGP